MTAYYNEIDPYAAQWLRNLIAAGHIAPGDVDERSIEDVKPDDLRGYKQCHFFAGVGVWSLALRRSGWDDNRPVWTGSCPCQPFSAAGKGMGVADERHLWPAFFHLITTAKLPEIPIFGEQVASKDGYAWLDLVQADLEGMGNTCWPVVLPAAGFGAPHERHRIWFVAERMVQSESISSGARLRGSEQTERGRDQHCNGNGVVGMVDTDGGHTSAEREQCCGEQRQQPEDCCALWLGHPDRPGSQPGQQAPAPAGYGGAIIPDGGGVRPGPTNGLWADADWLHCRDGKWRPVEPGTFPLAHGATSRVGRLRAYGNAINVEAATQFIGAYLQS